MRTTFTVVNEMEKLSKQEILDAAEETLRRFGPKKTSVTDIAKALKVSHGTIYRHYPSKLALKEAVTERWLEERIIAPLQQRLADSEAEAAEDTLKAYVLELISLKQTYAEHDAEMFEMYAEVTAESAELIDEHVNKIIEHLVSVIHKGIETNTMKHAEDKHELSRAIFYATARFHHPAHAYEWKSETIQEEFEKVWLLISKGFLHTGGETNG